MTNKTRLCRNCKHFIDVPVGPDAPLHFCDNPRTKQGPNPIGFLDFNAPACPFFEAHDRGTTDSHPTVIVIQQPPVVRDHGDSISVLEGKLLRVALLLVTIMGLLGFVAWHLRGLFTTLFPGTSIS